MGAEIKASSVGRAVSVGERVAMDGRDGEFVVVSVDPVKGLVELLRLNPGKLEYDVPLSNLKAKRRPGPRLVTNEPGD